MEGMERETIWKEEMSDKKTTRKSVLPFKIRMNKKRGTIIVCGRTLNLKALRQQMQEDFKDRYGIGDGEE